MAAKEIFFEAKASWDSFEHEKLGKSGESHTGTKGRNVALDKKSGSPRLPRTVDGAKRSILNARWKTWSALGTRSGIERPGFGWRWNTTVPF
jgi:hypothetical protein